MLNKKDILPTIYFIGRINMKFTQAVKANFLGVLLCVLIAVPAYFLGKLLPVVGGPVFGILIGMIVTLTVKKPEWAKSGVAYTGKKILQHAVILLGFGMNISVILAQGATSLPIIITTITTALVTAFIASKFLKTEKKVSQLIGIGSCICGGSAIAAAAPVIEADDSEIAQSISVIFLFNILAAVIFPALGAALGLTNDGFALFAGTAINDTSSVTAAASAWDDIHRTLTAAGTTVLDAAATVKLTRTLGIIPITLVLAFFQMHAKKKEIAERIANGEKDENGEEIKSTFSFRKIFPWFVIYFLLASVITTVFSLPASITAPLKWLSKFFIIMAMSAIGLNTNIIKLVKTGKKPILLGFICWIMIIFASLLMQHVMGFW